MSDDKGKRVSIQDVDRIAELARLAPSTEEKEQLASELADIVSFVEQLNELDTDKVEPLHHVLDLHTVLREDEVKPSLPVESTLQNAPQRKGDYFLVPKVIKK